MTLSLEDFKNIEHTVSVLRELEGEGYREVALARYELERVLRDASVRQTVVSSRRGG